MPTIRQLLDYSQAALASYALDLLPGIDNVSSYTRQRVGMAAAQATKFNTV